MKVNVSAATSCALAMLSDSPDSPTLKRLVHLLTTPKPRELSWFTYMRVKQVQDIRAAMKKQGSDRGETSAAVRERTGLSKQRISQLDKLRGELETGSARPPRK